MSSPQEMQFTVLHITRGCRDSNRQLAPEQTAWDHNFQDCHSVNLPNLVSQRSTRCKVSITSASIEHLELHKLSFSVPLQCLRTGKLLQVPSPRSILHTNQKDIRAFSLECFSEAVFHKYIFITLLIRTF